LLSLASTLTPSLAAATELSPTHLSAKADDANKDGSSHHGFTELILIQIFRASN